jgi:hypothetical protein
LQSGTSYDGWLHKQRHSPSSPWRTAMEAVKCNEQFWTLLSDSCIDSAIPLRSDAERAKCLTVSEFPSSRAHGPHRMDPRRMAQPQGQHTAGQLPQPDPCVQHRTKSTPRGQDVCGASGTRIHCTMITKAIFRRLTRIDQSLLAVDFPGV